MKKLFKFIPLLVFALSFITFDNSSAYYYKYDNNPKTYYIAPYNGSIDLGYSDTGGFTAGFLSPANVSSRSTDYLGGHYYSGDCPNFNNLTNDLSFRSSINTSVENLYYNRIDYVIDSSAFPKYARCLYNYPATFNLENQFSYTNIPHNDLFNYLSISGQGYAIDYSKLTYLQIRGLQFDGLNHENAPELYNSDGVNISFNFHVDLGNTESGWYNTSISNLGISQMQLMVYDTEGSNFNNNLPYKVYEYDCSTTFTDSGQFGSSVDFTCSGLYIPPTDHAEFGFLNLTFSVPSNSSDYSSFTDNSWIIDFQKINKFKMSFSLITNNDRTSSFISANSSESGLNTWIGDGLDSSDPHSIIDIWNFNNLANPLNPILDNFSDVDSCQNIPLVSDWLHTDPYVCPIFPSQLRSALTPAFQIFISILFFYFILRWLNKGGE